MDIKVNHAQQVNMVETPQQSTQTDGTFKFLLASSIEETELQARLNALMEEITEEDVVHIHEDYIKARRAWIAEIRKDAEKEYQMGDVEVEVYEDFLSKLDHEIDYEN